MRMRDDAGGMSWHKQGRRVCDGLVCIFLISFFVFL